jgi:hypothetical protein
MALKACSKTFNAKAPMFTIQTFANMIDVPHEYKHGICHPVQPENGIVAPVVRHKRKLLRYVRDGSGVRWYKQIRVEFEDPEARRRAHMQRQLVAAAHQAQHQAQQALQAQQQQAQQQQMARFHHHHQQQQQQQQQRAASALHMHHHHLSAGGLPFVAGPMLPQGRFGHAMVSPYVLPHPMLAGPYGMFVPVQQFVHS